MSHGLNQKNVLAAEISIRTGLEDLLLFRSSPSIWITYPSHAHGFVWSMEAQTLRKVGTIELPGTKSERFDYLAMDDEDHWLLSAHLGPSMLYVIDVRTNKLVKAIPGVPGITGLEYVPGQRKVYTSDWGEEKIGIVDLQTMKVTKHCDRREAKRKHLRGAISQSVRRGHPRKSCGGRRRRAIN